MLKSIMPLSEDIRFVKMLADIVFSMLPTGYHRKNLLLKVQRFLGCVKALGVRFYWNKVPARWSKN
jgi:hypothetical protein